MVVLARQLKESSLMMNQSIKNTEKVSRVLFASTVSQCNFFGDMTQSPIFPFIFFSVLNSNPFLYIIHSISFQDKIPSVFPLPPYDHSTLLGFALVDTRLNRESCWTQLGKHRTRQLTRNGDLLTEHEDLLLHMASDVCNDMHIHHGCTAHTCYLDFSSYFWGNCILLVEIVYICWRRQ